MQKNRIFVKKFLGEDASITFGSKSTSYILNSIPYCKKIFYLIARSKYLEINTLNL